MKDKVSRKYKTSKHLGRILIKLENKNKKFYESLLKKMNEVLRNPEIEHYKNLKYKLKEYKRIHVGSFVLLFKYDKQEDLIHFSDFGHHDKIYKK